MEYSEPDIAPQDDLGVPGLCRHTDSRGIPSFSARPVQAYPQTPQLTRDRSRYSPGAGMAKGSSLVLDKFALDLVEDLLRHQCGDARHEQPGFLRPQF